MNHVHADLDGNTNIAMDKLINQSVRTTIQVAVGIISNSAGQLLVAKRPVHWLGGGFWEFPGGKIEPNEDSNAALKRELLEEVGVVVEECSPLIHLTYDYPERTVIIQAWHVHFFTGVAAGLEGQEICWCDRKSINNINMLPANRAIVVATQLPDTYFITPECFNKTDFLHVLEQKLQQQNIKMLQLRSKDLSTESYVHLARKVLEICRRLDVFLLLNHHKLEVVEEVEADGIHLQSDQLNLLSARPVPKNKWVGASCHNVDQISKAEQIGADFIVVSPVQYSPSKFEPLGWEKFSTLVEMANVPVYALGGMTVDDIALAKKHGAQGIAGIRCFWNA